MSAPGFRRPPCGNNLTAHRPHRFPRWSSDTDQSGQCDGWTPMEAGVTEMATAVLDAIHTRQASPRAWFCPMCGREDGPALQLEVSQAAATALQQCIDLPYSTGPPVFDSMYGMPVVLAADLPRGGWRITEIRPAIAAGVVTMDTRSPYPDLPDPAPWDDPEVMAQDLQQAVRDIGAGAGPIGYRQAPPDDDGSGDDEPTIPG